MATDVIARLKLSAEAFSREVRTAFDKVPTEADRAGREAGTRMGTGIGAGLKAGIAGIAIGSALREIGQVTMRAVDFGVELGNNARALNSNVEELQAYREAANDVGIVNKQMDEGLQELFTSMTEAAGGSKDQAEAFRALGVSLVDTNGNARTTTAVMGEVIDKLDAIPDPLRQAQIGTELFGEKWREMAPLLDAGSDGLQVLTGNILATGEALSTKEIQELARINADLERMQTELERDVARTVAANADAIVTLGQAFGYMAGEAVGALAAVVNLYRGLNANGSYAGSNAAMEENKRIAAENRGEEAYDPNSWASWLGVRSAGTRRALPKGGKGGGGGAGSIDSLPTLPALPASIAPPRRVGGGKTRGGGGGSGRGGGVDKDARAAEQTAKQYERMEESLARALSDQRQAADIEALRAAGLARMADQQEALNQINGRWREIAGKTAEEVAAHFKITTEQAQALIGQLEQLRNGEVVKIDLEFDRKSIAEISKDLDQRFEDVMQKQNDDMVRAWEEADDLARQHFDNLSGVFFDLFDGNTRNIWDNFTRMGLNSLAELAADQTMKMLNGDKSANLGSSLQDLFSAQQGDFAGGMSKGALASGLAEAIGLKQSKTGAMVGSAIGHAVLGPLGGAIGGFLGGTVGGFFKKTKTGSATVGFDPMGELGTTATGGNSKKFREAAGGMAGSLTDQLNQIAAALGATLNSGTAGLSFGVRKGQVRVDPTGKGRTKVKNGAVDFGDDEAAAVRYATKLMLERGILGGISQASQNIMRNAGDDIEEALSKALMIEELPKMLRARLDPLGAELDAIDEKFRKLADVLREGGVSAEQIAQARQLWELERADAVREIGQASTTLRDYLKTLRIGADSPLSLRTQAVEAEAAMAPFIQQIRAADEAKARYDQLAASKAAGGTVSDVDLKAAKEAATAAASAVDQNGFRDSAALFLDVSRQLGGSTKSFFDQFDRIQGLTNSAIALVENAVPLRGDPKDPFAELTAKAAQSTANILDSHTTLLQQIAASLAGQGGGGGGAFVGGARNFMNAPY